MKKIIIISLAALLALASCTKKEAESSSREITFQTAAYLTRAGIDGPEFPTSETFGVYAWASGNPDGYFMQNEKIAYNSEGKWTAATEFYWPVKQTVDFFGYYPYGMQQISVAPKTISYSNLDVEATQFDALYSSKTVGYGFNPDGETRVGIDGSKGIPILFHHALSKVVVDARTAYDAIEEADGSKYSWKVTLNSVTVSNFYKKGGATFTLADEPKDGIVEWNKPAGNVWTNDGAKTAISNRPEVELNAETPVNVLPEFFVLPHPVDEPESDEQGWIIPGQQIHKVTANITVTTYLDGDKLIRETYDRSAYMYLEDIPAWQINHRIHYLLIIYPLGPGIGPDTERPVITFDPAVADWDYVTVTTSIIL